MIKLITVTVRWRHMERQYRKNTRPEVKRSARFLADTNIHDGALKILRLL